MFYPESPWHFNDSRGEQEVFERLHVLDDCYKILHSLRWLNTAGSRPLKGSLPVQGEADFVLLHPMGILVIEVKSGEILCEGRTWTQINTATKEEISMPDPVEQANCSVHYIRRRIAAELPALRYVGVFHAVWFPSIEFDVKTLPPDCDPSIVLDAADLDAPAAAIGRIFQFWRATFSKRSISKRSMSTKEQDSVLNVLAPSFRLLPTLRVAMQSRERQFVRLTREQALILDYLDEQPHALVSGPAGSGKTMLACELAKRIAASGEEVWFFLFTKDAAQVLERGCSQSYGSTTGSPQSLFHHTASICDEVH